MGAAHEAVADRTDVQWFRHKSEESGIGSRIELAQSVDDRSWVLQQYFGGGD